MQALKSRGWIDELNNAILDEQKKILGICLGMQLLCKSSDEGIEKGLGFLDAEVKKFKVDSKLKIPHMGWNIVRSTKKNSLIDVSIEQRFYFVHSFFVDCMNQEDVLAETQYGQAFTSAVKKNNIYGVQFHPEKSHKFGMALLTGFKNL